MTTQHIETIATRIKEMESRPENANHEWVFGWFASTEQAIKPNKVVIEEMHKAWAHFRSYCKRNNLEIQGVRRIKTTIKHKAQIFEVALFIPSSSLEVTKNRLNTAFPKADFNTTVMQPITQERGVQYILNKMLCPNQPSEKPTLINATQSRLATQTQQ
jgi:hypothetical protein